MTLLGASILFAAGLLLGIHLGHRCGVAYGDARARLAFAAREIREAGDE